MIEVELLGVRVEPPSNTPVVHLRELGGRGRNLTIFIGGPEATAIAFALEGVDTPRPLTHDLFCTVLDDVDADLGQVVINDLRDTTYFAVLHLEHDGRQLQISARPSDAIALAVRVACPIYVTDEVMDAAGFVEESDGESPPEDVVEEFRQFIDNVSPEDFGS